MLPHQTTLFQIATAKILKRTTEEWLSRAVLTEEDTDLGIGTSKKYQYRTIPLHPLTVSPTILIEEIEEWLLIEQEGPDQEMVSLLSRDKGEDPGTGTSRLPLKLTLTGEEEDQEKTDTTKTFKSTEEDTIPGSMPRMATFRAELTEGEDLHGTGIP